MAFFFESGKSFDLIFSEVTKANQLEVLSKKIPKKCSLETKKQLLKIIDALDEHDTHWTR